MSESDLTYEGSTAKNWVPIEDVLASLAPYGYGILVDPAMFSGIHIGLGESVIWQPEVKVQA